ncbi:MAG: hypothetical protein AB7O49_20635 [Sphingomonadales bacterium]
MPLLTPPEDPSYKRVNLAIGISLFAVALSFLNLCFFLWSR